MALGLHNKFNKIEGENMVTREEVIQIMDENNLLYSEQFLEIAIKLNSKKVIEEFCVYWKHKSIGGGELANYFIQHYKGDN